MLFKSVIYPSLLIDVWFPTTESEALSSFKDNNCPLAYPSSVKLYIPAGKFPTATLAIPGFVIELPVPATGSIYPTV